MSWIDVALLLLIAILTALGVQRRLAGLLLAVAALLLLRPLLLLARVSPLLTLLAALVIGLALGLAGRGLSRAGRSRDRVSAVLGGAGGFLLGIMLVLALVTSLPIERNLSNQIVYPPRELPLPIARQLTSSRLVRLGRDILLYPLLEPSVTFTSSQQLVYRGLHSLLVVGTPWEGR